MSEPTHREPRPPTDPASPVIKGVPVAGQAEQLVRVRREITRAEEMSRAEQIEHEAREKAEAFLNKAKAEAEQMVAKARGEADSIREKARSDGDLGAKREALQRLAGLISNLEKEIALLKSVRADFLRTNVNGIIDLACAIAQKIMVHELNTRPEAVAQRARALLERMPTGVGVTITASPDDIETIQRYLIEAGGPSDAILPALRSDPSMDTGCMRLESDCGRIDAGVLDVLEGIGSILNEQARHFAEDDFPWWEGGHGR